MKRLLSLMAFGLTIQFSAWAQPSLIFPPSSPNSGDQFCVSVTVKDFTDIISMQFSLNWNPAVLDFERVQGFGLPSFSGTNFNTSLAGDGKLSVNWQVAQCSPSATGITIADGSTIFQLCFRALGSYGATSPITLSSDPTPINVQRVNACPNNIGMLSNNGLVSIGVRPLTLIASQETGNEGDLVCVDFRVTGFDKLTSMQFSVNWDPAQLRFENVVIPGNLINLANSSFGTPNNPSVGAGNLTVSWSYTDPVDPGVNLPDSTIIFQVCYRITGRCGTTVPITFSDSPTPFEVTNTVRPGFRLTGQNVAGRVRVGTCTPAGLQLFANCGPPVNPNTEVCVKISTAGFANVREMNWNLEWNENILQFLQVRNITTAIPGFNAGSFNTSNASNGVLGVNWTNPQPIGGVSLPGGAGDLFEVCFRVVGVGGGSPIKFGGSPATVVRNNVITGINPSNCAVEVIRPDGVIMTLSNAEKPLGDTTCMNVSVSNFKDIVGYQFSLAWEPTHASFINLKNINLPGASMSNFQLLGVDAGSLSFEWTSPTGQTVPDNTVIFQACFEMVGTPQTCKDLLVVNEPRVVEAISSTSNGNDIGVTIQNAELCVLFPEGYFLDIRDAAGEIGSRTCMPVAVVNFKDIVSTQVAISWEPSALRFSGVQIPTTNPLPGLTAANFDTTSARVGLLRFNWNNGTMPVTRPDSTIIFELCFDLVGQPDTCFQVRVGDPIPTVTTINGSGSVLSDPGKICIKDKLVITDTTINAVSCPGTNDGSIVITVSGGRNPIGITWETNPPQFGPQARNLPPGRVPVVIFDNSNPALVLRDTFEIPLNSNLPVANAGEDKPFVCDPPIVPLQGQGSQGANFTYRWTTLDGRLTPDNDRLNTGALAPGTYVLAVTNTQTGCVARDTVRIIAQDFPSADAGLEKSINCLIDSTTVGGTLSSAGPNIRYLWQARDGGVIAPGQDTLLTPVVRAPGTYILAVTNTQSRCVSRDTVVVRDNRTDFPNANAGDDQRLGCDEGSRVTLSSRSVNDSTAVLEFEWLKANGEVISRTQSVDVDSLGTYLLKVTNLRNGCAALDTVRVLPNEQAPQLSFGEARALTCKTDTVTISATVANSTKFIFEWSATNGGALVAGTETSLTPKTTLPGVYRLVVRDTATNCSIADTISIRESKELPTVVAGARDTLTCQDTSLVLNATGTSTGAEFSYKWLLNGATVATDTLRPRINTPGTYILEVTNTRTGCVATDSVVISPDRNAPQVVLPVEVIRLDCQTPSRTIQATITPANPAFTIEWTTANGNITGSRNTNTVEVNRAGTYQIKVTNPNNGCTTSSDAVVEDSSQLPNAKAGADTSITCANEVIALSGAGSSVGADFTYQWNAISGGATPSPNNALQTSINRPGSYELVVTNRVTGCIGRDTIQVAENRTAPQIRFANIPQFSCSVTKVNLDASGSTANGNLTAQWNGLSGSTPTLTNNQLIVEVTRPGRYELILTNNANGCVSRDTVEVRSDPNQPTAVIARPDTVTCARPTAALNAGGSTPNGNFRAEWTRVSGNGSVQQNPTNPLLATATGGGTYQLKIIRTTDNCEAIATVEVPENKNVPMANAVAEKPSIGCGESTAINSTGSSSGPGISYRWAVLSGTATIANPTQPSIQVDKAGNFQLIVTNAANGCSDTATVAVTFNVQFGQANAGADRSVCEPTTALIANLPNGTTGSWTSLSGAGLSATNQAEVTATNLRPGDNRFIWTLSAPGCENYSADTLVIKLETAPDAVDDALTLKAGETTGSLVVTANDVTTNIASFNISITRNPTLGTATPGAAGRVAYTVKRGVFGQDEFLYKLCSATCPTLCDSALVRVLIEEDPNYVPQRVNAITPNGDGVNEQLIFEELLTNADQYPDNELIIFNRWGDIVYQARPYNNNWEGTNNSGQNLPEGTYYYILRLNISEGLIIRGDVTIVR